MKRHICTHGLLALPAVTLGVLAMAANSIAAMLWCQQAVAFLLCGALSILFARKRRMLPKIILPLLLLILAAALMGPEAGGVKRWITLGPLSVHAAMLTLPLLMVILAESKAPWVPLVITGVILCLQPDLSQLAALTAAALPLLWRLRKQRMFSGVTLVLMAALLLKCCFMPTCLEPAAHSEGILRLLGSISPVLWIAGLISLLLIPAGLLYRFKKEEKLSLMCLAIYYAVTILFSLGGNYPVPLMGFGLSPVVGFWLAMMFA